MVIVVNTEKDDEPCHAQECGKQGEDVTVFRVVGHDSCEHGKAERGRPWRYGE